MVELFALVCFIVIRSAAKSAKRIIGIETGEITEEKESQASRWLWALWNSLACFACVWFPPLYAVFLILDSITLFQYRNTH
jgi:hypothetical protein